MRKWKISCLLVFLYCILLMAYVNEPFFISDEGDIFEMGSAIAKGRMLYSEIPSQHMPVMYYISAFFSMLGASTMTEFRICFYLLMAVLWGLMYYRYSDSFKKSVLIIYPVIYIVLLKYIDRGHAVLSEQFQGIGMAILLIELLVFEEHRELKIGNMVMISIAVFLSFGSAFVAAFGIAFVVLTFVLLEMQRYHKLGMGLLSSLRTLAISYWKLVAVVAAPFAVLILYYLLTGTFDDFVSWSYVINRTVYSKYTGYGNSILESALGSISLILGALTLPAGEPSFRQLIYFFSIAGAIPFFVIILKERKNWLLAAGIFLFWIGTATRGLFNFHGTPAIAVVCVMDAYVLTRVFAELREKRCSQYLLVALLVYAVFPYISLLTSFDFQRMIKGLKVETGSVPYMIDLITDDKEVVGLSTLDTNYIIESHTVPTKLNAACPWVWEFGGEEELEKLKKDPPRVFIYSPDYEIWGYKIAEFAAPLKEFILQNYTDLQSIGYPFMYIRNDYYAEAIEIMDTDSIARTGYPCNRVTLEADDAGEFVEVNMTNGGVSYSQVQYAVWTEENGQDDLRFYAAELDDKNVWSYTFDLQDHPSKGKCYVHIYAVKSGESALCFVQQYVFEIE